MILATFRGGPVDGREQYVDSCNEMIFFECPPFELSVKPTARNERVYPVRHRYRRVSVTEFEYAGRS